MTTVSFFDRQWMPAFRICLVCAIALCGNCPFAPAATTSQPGPINALANQQFFCSAAFDRHECLQHVAKLKAVLIHYPASVPGHWSWIVVRSEDWQPLLLRLRLDQRSPAFTNIDNGETFLEEALFLPLPIRTDELEKDFRISFGKLLSAAVRHELGHAICHG